MKWLTTLREFPEHDSWVLVKANIQGDQKLIMAQYQCIVSQGKPTDLFTDYLGRKLYFCKCNPIEWRYVDKVHEQQHKGTMITEDYFGIRALHCLNKSNIYTLEELCTYSAGELLSIYGLGITTLDSIQDELDFLQLHLREEE